MLDIMKLPMKDHFCEKCGAQLLNSSVCLYNHGFCEICYKILNKIRNDQDIALIEKFIQPERSKREDNPLVPSGYDHRLLDDGTLCIWLKNQKD